MTQLTIGDKAPQISSPDQDGNPVNLADSEKSHQGFIAKFKLPFPLIADVDKKVLQDYGIWGPKKFMGKTYDGIHRTTFIIGEDGSIERIINDVDTKNHTYQILEG